MNGKQGRCKKEKWKEGKGKEETGRTESALASAGPCQSSDACYGERGAPAYNGRLGAEPPAGVQGQSPRWGSERLPPEAECLYYFACPQEAANLPDYRYLSSH